MTIANAEMKCRELKTKLDALNVFEQVGFFRALSRNDAMCNLWEWGERTHAKSFYCECGTDC